MVIVLVFFKNEDEDNIFTPCMISPLMSLELRLN